jgi:hypothetical protein
MKTNGVLKNTTNLKAGSTSVIEYVDMRQRMHRMFYSIYPCVTLAYPGIHSRWAAKYTRARDSDTGEREGNTT